MFYQNICSLLYEAPLQSVRITQAPTTLANVVVILAEYVGYLYEQPARLMFQLTQSSTVSLFIISQVYASTL